MSALEKYFNRIAIAESFSLGTPVVIAEEKYQSFMELKRLYLKFRNETW